MKRGHENGAAVELYESTLREAAPEVKSASGRALWSPNTAVMNPLMVIRKLQEDLIQRVPRYILAKR